MSLLVANQNRFMCIVHKIKLVYYYRILHSMSFRCIRGISNFIGIIFDVIFLFVIFIFVASVSASRCFSEFREHCFALNKNGRCCAIISFFFQFIHFLIIMTAHTCWHRKKYTITFRCLQWCVPGTAQRNIHKRHAHKYMV